LKNLILLRKKLFGYILFFVLAAILPLVVTSPYYHDLFIIIIVNSVLAMTFVMLLRTGLINLGLAAFWGIGAYSSTLIAMKLGLPVWLSIPATLVVTIILALLVGLFLIGKGSAGFGFVMLSSVIGMVFSVAVGSVTEFGGYIGISKIPRPEAITLPFLPPIVFDNKLAFYYLALLLFLFIILIITAFYSAWIGRAWSAIGLNSRLAESIGIDLIKYKLTAFVVSSAIAGLIGSFYAHYQGFVQPTTYDMFANIYIQIYAILGGVGFPIVGPILGATVMTLFPELFRIGREFSPIFTGVLLIVLIMFLPTGLLSLGHKFKEWRENRSGKPGAGKSIVHRNPMS
jgi:branched-chain amino acid transport system permease protein